MEKLWNYEKFEIIYFKILLWYAIENVIYNFFIFKTNEIFRLICMYV